MNLPAEFVAGGLDVESVMVIDWEEAFTENEQVSLWPVPHSTATHSVALILLLLQLLSLLLTLLLSLPLCTSGCVVHCTTANGLKPPAVTESSDAAVGPGWRCRMSEVFRFQEDH